MSLFGKKPKVGENKENKRKKKVRAKKNKRTFKNPPDAKLFYRMPLILMLGIVCIIVGSIIVWGNDLKYNHKVMSSSMPKGTQLPIRQGTGGRGSLTLGNSLLSADGETLAVEIQYNDEAHSSLSSFGDNYNLYLIETKDSPMKDVKLSYGMFGTDGSGVLTINKKGGFEDRAFMVFLIDKGVIVSSDALETRRTMTNDEIEKSLAKQLEELEENHPDDEVVTTKSEVLPPTYMIRLNAFNTKKSYRSWQSDSEIVEDLFVDGNLKKVKKNQEEIEEKIKAGEQSLDEMNKRLEKNENDSTAQTNKQELERTLETLNQELEKAKENYDKISKSNIKKDVLAPKQEEFKTYTVVDINRVK